MGFEVRWLGEDSSNNTEIEQIELHQGDKESFQAFLSKQKSPA